MFRSDDLLSLIYGVRDRGLLDLCVGRPAQSAHQQDAFPTLELKAAALTEAIINVHPFIDANKRTGIMAGMSMLLVNGHTPVAESDDLYAVAIEVESGLMTLEGLADWMRDTNNVLPLSADEVRTERLFNPDIWEIDELEPS